VKEAEAKKDEAWAERVEIRRETGWCAWGRLLLGVGGLDAPAKMSASTSLACE